MLKNRLQRNQSRPRTIAILGMHRSGTSLLTGSLQQAGLELHRYHSFNHHNRKGNRENQDIVDLHDEILAANGGSWDQPPPQVSWRRSDLDRARRIIDDCRDYPVWGFKDPRTLLTLQGWLDLLPQLEMVGVVRHPVAVAMSLQARDPTFTLQQGLDLWQGYNRRLLDYQQQHRFPMICFDTDSSNLQARLSNLAGALDLPHPQALRFYDPELVNQGSVVDCELPADVQSLYQALLENCLTDR